MHLARFRFPGYQPDALRRLLDRTNLDFLQVDRTLASAEGESCGSASRGKWDELSEPFKLVHKTLFLRPDFTLVTNAGSGSVLSVTESLAEFVVEHGSPNIPIAAIRGDNVIDDLDSLLEGNCRVPKQRIVSARVELGAGPLATALADGARIVVAGTYDRAAPFIAAALSRGICSLGDIATLGSLAAASQFEGAVVNVLADGTVEMEEADTSQVRSLRTTGTVDHADVRCRYDGISLEPTPRGTVRLGCDADAPPSASWNLKIRSESGWLATALLTVPHGESQLLCEQCRSEFRTGRLTCAAYQQLSKDNTDGILLRLEYEHESAAQCRQFVSWLQLAVESNPSLGRIIAPFPSVSPLTETCTVAVPAERIIVSVDTRPASEWL